MRTMRAASTSPLVVIGDSLLDVDVSGTATRLCPGEPAPVLEGAVETAEAGRRRAGGGPRRRVSATSCW